MAKRLTALAFPRALTVALACAVGVPAAQAADKVDLTMGVIVSPGDLYSKYTQSVPERLAKATDGRVSVTVSDSLVAPAQIASTVRDGRLPMSAALHTYLAAEEPRMGIFNLPGLINDIGDYTKVRQAFWADDVAAIWARQWNAKVLAEGAWCTTRLFSKTPIHSLADFKNKRLRVHNPQTAALMETLGAKPTPLPVSEMMPALERGVIDGVFTSACVGNAMELWRVAGNVQDWGLSPITGWAILMNQDEWNRLPKDLQAKMSAEMKAIETEAFANHTAYVDAALKEMEGRGAKMWSADAKLRAELADPKLNRPAYDSWYARAKEVGFDGQAYIAKVRAALGR